MAEYEYVKRQENRIEKNYDHLMEEYRVLMKEGEIEQIKRKYQNLLEKKKLGKLGLIDEIMLDIYRDAIEIEEHKNK